MANQLIGGLDGPNKKLILQVVDEDGNVVASWGIVELKLGQDPGGSPAENPGTTMGKEITLRETEGCDEDGNPQFCIMLRSKWYPTQLTSNPRE